MLYDCTGRPMDFGFLVTVIMVDPKGFMQTTGVCPRGPFLFVGCIDIHGGYPLAVLQHPRRVHPIQVPMANVHMCDRGLTACGHSFAALMASLTTPAPNT